MHRRSENGLFDESRRMTHSPRAMKWFGILLVATCSAVCGWAQETNSSTTNAVAPETSYTGIANPTGLETNAATGEDANAVVAPDLVYGELTNSLGVKELLPESSRELSLQECIRLTLKYNLELRIDRFNPQIAEYQLKGAYAPYDPAAFFSGQHSHSESGATFLGTNIIGGALSDADSFSTSVSGQTPSGATYKFSGTTADTIQNNGFLRRNAGAAAQFTATQPLLKNLWIDGNRLVIQVDKNRLKYSQEQFRLNLMTLITQLEQNYYQLIYNRESVVVQQKAAESTDRLVSETRMKLRFGAAAELDLASAEAQAAQNRAAIITAQSALGTQERKIKLFITDDIAAWADVGIEPVGDLTAVYQTFNRQESWRKAIEMNPLYKLAKLDVDRGGIQVKYDFNQLFPEVDVFGTYGYNGSGTVYSGALFDIQQQNLPFYVVGGQMTMPLANIGARNSYRADKATLQQLVLTLKKQERDILIAVDNDIGTLQADYDAVLATHAQRLYEEQALAAEQKKLDNGKSTTYNVLLVQRDLTSARGNEIQALNNYNFGLSQLSFDEGSTLERLNIDLQIK